MTALASAPSFNFVVASGPLRPHLSGPLSQFVDPTRILAIVSQDGAKYLFKSEREFPPVDLRKASYLSVVTRRPAQSLGAFKPSEGQFKNCLTTVTGDVAIIRPDIFIQDAEGHTARFWSGVELLLGKLDEAFSRIEAEPEQPVTSVIVPIDDDLDAVFSDAGVIHVSGLKLRIIAPPRPVPAALESRILPAPSIHFGERSHVYIAAAAATASVAPPAPAVAAATLATPSPAASAAVGKAAAPMRSSAAQAELYSVHPSAAVPASAPPRPLTDILADAVRSALASGELDPKRLLQSADGAPSGLIGQGSEDLELNTSSLSQQTEPTLCSVFAPPVVEPHKSFDIQVMLHAPVELMEAASTALRHDPKARRRAYAPLKMDLTRGQLIKFYLDSADLIVASPIASMRWDGDLQTARFQAEIAPHVKKDTVEGVVHVYLGHIPIGAIHFDLAVKPVAQQTRATTRGQPVTLADTKASGFVPATSHSNRYGRAFLSYARKDVAYASIFAEGLHNSGIDLFVDITALEPGDDWKAKLIEAIQTCDVFYLLWSNNAAASEWVRRECAEACKRLQSGRSMPFNIHPMMLEDELPGPPYCIADLHCDSQWRRMRLAGERPPIVTPT